MELSLHVFILLSLGYLMEKAQWVERDRTWLLLSAFFVLALSYRAITGWNPALIWSRLAKQPHGDSTFLLRDLALKRGTFPKDQPLSDAVLETASKWSKPSFPYFSIWKEGGFHFLVTIALAVPILISDSLSGQWSQDSQQLSIRVTPPHYLKRPSRQLHPQEQQLKVFPGSLIRWSSSSKSAKLSDAQQRQYFSRNEAGLRQFESRVMEPNTFHFTVQEQKHALEVELLKDSAPTITWLTPTQHNSPLAPTSMSFSCKDDHGLEETLITVNGREIEYAGQPKGLRRHQYRWMFNPNDHIDLLGGNIVLQISAYDNDKINGPKVTLSQPWTWDFPGVEQLSVQASQRIAELKKLSIERQNGKASAKSPEIQKQLLGLEQELRNNPALSPDLANMVAAMARDYQRHAGQNLPKSSESEKQELARNDDILDSIQSMLDQVISTVRAAELVKTMSELQKDLDNGKHDPQKMEEAYKKLAEHLNQSSMPEGLKQKMLSTFNQAELSASMGDTQGASKSMEQLMEVLRQQPSMPQAPNPMAEKFEKLMADLGKLIQQQQAVMENWSKAKTVPIQEDQQRSIQNLKDLIRKNHNWQAYDQMIQSLRKQPRVDNAEQQNLLQELSRPNSPTQRGRMLQQVSQQLDRRAAGHANPQPMPPFLPWAPDIEKQLKALPQLPSTSKAPVQKLETEQRQLAQAGQQFSEKFKLDFGPLMPNPGLFQLAKQAALLAKRAAQSIAQSHPSSEMAMNQAALHWIQLRQQLQQMQQQGQGGQGSSRPQLSIGKDGKLQLSPQGQPQQENGDGDWKHNPENLDIALPEEFQNSQKIEKMLRDELKQTSDEQRRDTFQHYILELLE
jgi:hypothetical protein